MQKYEEERESDYRAEGWSICDAPRDGCEEEKEGEEVGEGRIRSVPGVFRFCVRRSVSGVRRVSSSGGW